MSTILSNEFSQVISDIRLDQLSEGKPLPPWMFNLEGTFLGCFSDKKSQRVKSIVIAVEQEELAIELPKRLRASAHRAIQERLLKPGDRIRCIGRSQLNFSLGIIQLKAYCLFLESFEKPSSKAADSASGLQANTTQTELVDLRALRDSRDPSTAIDKQRHAKILVCHKSGCKKRGGRQLISALKQVLEAYELKTQVEIQYTGCQKRCSKAPGITIFPGNYHYDRLTHNSLPGIIEKHFC